MGLGSSRQEYSFNVWYDELRDCTDEMTKGFQSSKFSLASLTVRNREFVIGSRKKGLLTRLRRGSVSTMHLTTTLLPSYEE